MNEPPCRLFVIMARDARLAVILRRGPSEWYHLIRWHTEQDAFESGAWLHGRIYEERCDLSPDGSLFVAMCYRGYFDPDYRDSWIAVSRAPWLYALALWPLGTTHGGGGRFLDNRRVALHINMPIQTHPNHPARGLEVVFGGAEYHKTSVDVEDADWSGCDHRGQLVFCRGGRLFRRKSGATGQVEDHELADFNGLRPAPQPAPDWARQPLG